MLIAITVNFRNSTEKRQIQNGTVHFLLLGYILGTILHLYSMVKEEGNKRYENDRKSLMTNLMMAEMKVWQVKNRERGDA
jgi:hypothetical protein